MNGSGATGGVETDGPTLGDVNRGTSERTNATSLSIYVIRTKKSRLVDERGERGATSFADLFTFERVVYDIRHTHKTLRR